MMTKEVVGMQNEMFKREYAQFLLDGIPPQAPGESVSYVMSERWHESVLRLWPEFDEWLLSHGIELKLED